MKQYKIAIYISDKSKNPMIEIYLNALWSKNPVEHIHIQIIPYVLDEELAFLLPNEKEELEQVTDALLNLIEDFTVSIVEYLKLEYPHIECYFNSNNWPGLDQKKEDLRIQFCSFFNKPFLQFCSTDELSKIDNAIKNMKC